MLMVQQGCPKQSDAATKSIRALNQPASHSTWHTYPSVPCDAKEGKR